MPGRVDAVVIGAGFAGLYMLHELRCLGFSRAAFEAAPDVGGTWYWNRYPGARCDVESLAYSYGFDPQLEQDWTWTERYAAQPEILRYINHVADRFDLRPEIAFGTRVTSAVYDEDRALWTVATDRGHVVEARFVITAVGCLSHAKDIDIPGAGSFAGQPLHTSRWPHETVDLTGKRVAVVGTGSTAIQLIPAVAEQAAQVTVFQRSPNYSVPAQNRPLSDAEVAATKADYRNLRAAWRVATLFAQGGAAPTRSALECPDAERRAIYEEAWANGSPAGLLAAFTDILTDHAANETVAEFVRGKIRGMVSDPQTAEDLAPTDHPYGTKRPCIDTAYFETFNEPHVQLVNLRRTPITEITAAGVRTTEGEQPFDVLIYATGFDAMVGALNAIDIRGRGGQSLRGRWEAGPEAYLGLAVAGFPNLFTITGPGSPSVLSNVVISIEQHVDWIAACMVHMREAGYATVEAEPDAQAAWVDHVRAVAEMTLMPQAASWYMGANVPGRPRVFMPYVAGVAAYRTKCDEVAAAGYAGFRLTASQST